MYLPHESIVPLGNLIDSDKVKIMNATMLGEKLVDHLPYRERLVLETYDNERNSYSTLNVSISKDQVHVVEENGLAGDRTVNLPSGKHLKVNKDDS